MSEELIKAGNGADALQATSKRSARKTTRKVEDNTMNQKQTPEEVVAEVQKTAEETVTEAKKTAEKTVTETKKAAEETATEAKKAVETKVEAATAAAQETAAEVKTAAGGAEPGAGIKKVMKDASTQVEKLPGTKQVRGVVSKVADQVGSNEMTQKAVRRVRESAREAGEQVKQGAQELEKNPLVVAAHKVLLAGVGAAVLAQEEIEEFVNRLIERGSIAEADGKRMINDVLDQRLQQVEKATERAHEAATEMRSNWTQRPKRLADDLEQRIEGVLAKMNIPTKEEIETLTAKITALTHKVDELKKTE